MQQAKSISRFRTLYALSLLVGLSWHGLNNPTLASQGVSSWDTYKKAALIYQDSGPSKEVIDLCSQVRRTARNTLLYARSSFLLAQALADQSHFDRAHRVLQAVYSGKRDIHKVVQNEARLRDAVLFLREDKRDDSITLTRWVAENAASRFVLREARLGLAQLYADAQHWQQSDSLATQVLNGATNLGLDERAIVLKARRAVASTDVQGALDLLQNCRSKSGLALLADAYKLADKPLMSVGVYKKIHDQFPNSAEAEKSLLKAAEIFMTLEDWLAAKTQLERLVENFPQGTLQIPAYFRLGWVYLGLNQFEDALAAFQRARSPLTARHVSFMQAECLRRQAALQPERYPEAIDAYNRIVTVDSNSPLAPHAKLRSALTMFEMGDRENGVVALRQFLAQYPKSDLAPTITYLLANEMPESDKSLYFRKILNGYPGDEVYATALAALQVHDYHAGNYQEIINREAHLEKQVPVVVGEYWQRINQLILAESAYYEKQYKRATALYAQVAEDSKDDMAQKAALGIAWSLLQSGRLDSAASQFDACRPNFVGENYARASFGLATTHFRMGRFEEAIESYPLNLDTESHAAMAQLAAKSLYRAGESYSRLNYHNQAVELWEKLVTIHPDSELAAEAQFKVADTYFRANYFPEAIAAFKKVAASFPDHSLAVLSALRIAQSQFNAGEYQLAIANFEKFVRQFPEHEGCKDALEGIQLGYYQLGESEHAVAALSSLVDQFPNGALAADARLRLAGAHLESGGYNDAVATLKELLSLYPNSSYAPDAQFSLAFAYFSERDFSSANAEFSRFIRYFPDSPRLAEVLFHLGLGYFNLGSYLTASEYFDQILQHHQESAFHGPALQNIGWCFDQLGEKQRAMGYFEQYLAAAPAAADREKVMLQIARIQLKTGNLDRAISILKELQASAESELAGEATYRLGMAYMQSQERELARATFKFGIKKGLEGSHWRLSAISQLATLYEEKHDWKSAVDAYKLLVKSTIEEKWIDVAQERIKELQALLERTGAEIIN